MIIPMGQSNPPQNPLTTSFSGSAGGNQLELSEALHWHATYFLYLFYVIWTTVHTNYSLRYLSFLSLWNPSQRASTAGAAGGPPISGVIEGIYGSFVTMQVSSEYPIQQCIYFSGKMILGSAGHMSIVKYSTGKLWRRECDLRPT
jgi:hypothetical protein